MITLAEGMANCIGCGNPATKYCDGWNHSSESGEFGSFEFSSQCGYPVCDTCEHVSNDRHDVKTPSEM